jgi:hypothetical protein
MDSNSIYQNLCNSRKVLKEQWVPGSGLHRHHIVPKHSGGSDDESNYTYLTPKEHIIAHYLLWRIYKNPNDLRSMHMLGAQLTVEQRRAVGKFCHKHKIGFHGASKKQRKAWAKKGLETQKKSQDKNSFYYWSTAEGRKQRASLGGRAGSRSQIQNKTGIHIDNKKKRSEWASLGAKSHTGKKCMHRPGDKTFIRVSPEQTNDYLRKGYIFGSPHSPRKGCYKKRPLMIEGQKYNSVHEASEKLNLTLNTIKGRIRSPKRPDWFFCNES